MRNPKKSFVVSVELPEGVSVKEMREYIRDAVQIQKGASHPDDPIFDLDQKTVKVFSVKRSLVDDVIEAAKNLGSAGERAVDVWPEERDLEKAKKRLLQGIA